MQRRRSGLNTVSVVIPWPARELSPNARVHWAKKGDAVATARGFTSAMTEYRRGAFGDGVPLEMWVLIEPPNLKKRDLDNILASLKPSIDGIADGVGFNDAQIESVHLHRMPPIKGGRITIEIEPA